MKNSYQKKEKINLFQKLQNDLSRIISETPPGERLKSEPELSADLGVSRATLREAMRNFEGQGLIRRRQGVGTFVLDRNQNIETGLEVLESIETLASRLKLEVRMGFLEVSQLAADEAMAAKFDLPLKSPINRIARVIWISDRPVAYLIDNVIPQVVAIEELDDTFTGSVLDKILRRNSPELSISKTTVSATPASPAIAKKMQLQRDDVLLKMEAYLYTKDGAMIDYSESYFIPGFFRFQVIRSVGHQNRSNG